MAQAYFLAAAMSNVGGATGAGGGLTGGSVGAAGANAITPASSHCITLEVTFEDAGGLVGFVGRTVGLTVSFGGVHSGSPGGHVQDRVGVTTVVSPPSMVVGIVT